MVMRYGPSKAADTPPFDMQAGKLAKLSRRMTAESEGNEVDPWAKQKQLFASGAIATTPQQYREGQGVWNVKDYGAVGDGTTNDTRAFTECIQQAVEGDTIYVPPGDYLIDPIHFNVSQRILMDPGATLIANSLTNNHGLLCFEGSASTGVSTNLKTGSPAVRGDLAITVVSTTGFAAGDWIRIEDTGAAGTAFEYEFARIRAVDGAETLRLTWPLELQVTYSGSAGVTNVTKLRMLERVVVEGGNIDGNSLGGTNVSLISLQYCAGSIVTGTRLSNFDYVGLDVKTSIFTRVQAIDVFDSSADLQAATPPNAGYGVMLRESTAHTIVANSRFRQLRHAVDAEQGAYHVTVVGNDIAGCFSAAILTHDRRALQITIVGNIISGSAYRSNSTFTTSAVSVGITVQSTDTRVVIADNVILNMLGPGISVNDSPLDDAYVLIENNLIVDCVPSDTSTGSIYVVNKRHVKISGNKIIRRDTTSGAGVRVQTSEDIQIIGNEVDFVTAYGASANAGGIYVNDCVRAIVSGNIVHLDITSGQCYRLGASSAGASTVCTFIGNIANKGSGSASAFLQSANATQVRQTQNSWSPTTGVSANVGDASKTLVMSDEETQRFATALTANRTVTLPTTDVYKGAKFRVVRTGLGAFTLDVGGLKTIPSATAAFVDVEYDGSAWRLSGYGTL